MHKNERERGTRERARGGLGSPENEVLANDSSETRRRFSWSLRVPERRFLGEVVEERGGFIGHGLEE
jgi:hypothetical protein